MSEKRILIPRICEICAAEFGARKWSVKVGYGRFCSKQCRNKYARSKVSFTGEKNGAWKGGVHKQPGRYDNLRKRWSKENPEARRAHKEVARAIKIGVLKKQNCENCGSTENIHAHHGDYSKPLDVDWLCNSCHQKHHARGTPPMPPNL